MNDEVHASIVLNYLPEITPVRFQTLIQHYGSAEKALKDGPFHWAGLADFTVCLPKLAARFDAAQREAEKDILWIQKQNVKVLMLQSGFYPPLLREIHHAPPIIYAMGESLLDTGPAVALVGSRRCTYYGEKIACSLANDLAQIGVVTVSGLARGIDTHVHTSTLKAKGKTWAVIGSGLKEIYPPENKKLAVQIEKSGTVLSEFPLSAKPHPANFPRRNRIIAGISLGTVLIEGNEKSGSLITARLAAEEGRDVYAVPGPITSNLSVAPHRLLRLGAKMVESATDIIEEFAKCDRDKLLTAAFSNKNRAKLPPSFQKVISEVGEEPMPKEILAMRLEIDASKLAPLLLEMELKNLIRITPSGSIIKQ